MLLPSYVLYMIGFVILGMYPSFAVYCLQPSLLESVLLLSSRSSNRSLELRPPAQKGKAISTFFLAYDTGFGIGALILATVASGIGYSNMFLSCSLIVLVSGLLYFTFTKRQAASSETEELAS